MLTEMQKNEKGPLSHRKIKCLFLDYIQQSGQKMLTEMQKNENRPDPSKKLIKMQNVCFWITFNF